MLNCFQRQPVATAVQDFVAATGFQGKVAAAGARIDTIKRETLTGPLFKLLDRYRP